MRVANGSNAKPMAPTCVESSDPGPLAQVDQCVRLAGAFIPPELFISVIENTLRNGAGTVSAHTVISNHTEPYRRNQ